MFGVRLRHARLDQGLSQEVLAKGICSASAISRWESGHSVPSEEIITALAQRLDIHPAILTGREVHARLIETPEGWADIITSVFGEMQDTASSSIATWLHHARALLEHVDHLDSDTEVRYNVDDLSVHPLTELTPVASEIVEVIEALVSLTDNPSAERVDRVIDTLVWAADLPASIQRQALELVVFTFVMVDMPVCARGAVVKVQPESITATTRFLLRRELGEDLGLPPVHAGGGRRDGAIDMVERLTELGVEKEAWRALQGAFPGDPIVRAMSERYGPASTPS